MTHALTIHSPFNDLSELVDGLAPFYTGEHLVVRAPSDVPEGEWIRFEILLTDGTPGLTGLGRHAGTNDNGEDFGAERFDVYLGELQVDEGRSDVIWERIVLAFQQTQGGDRPTGEVDISQVEAELAAAPVAAEEAPDEAADEVAADEVAGEAAEEMAAAEEPVDDMGLEDADSGVAAADFESDAATVAAPISEFPEEVGSDAEFSDAIDDEPEAYTPAPIAAAPAPRAARPAAPAAPARPASVLTRPSLPASWAPTADAPSARPSNGYFDYGDSGLPVPAHPPRPDGEERRIDAAPRPLG